MHKNKIVTLPATIADLSALTVLDLSRNALTSLPENIWSLPELSTLNVSHNKLTSLPFKAPFKSANGVRGNQYTSTDFFTPAVCRAVTPLPHLLVLDASNNQITAAGVDDDLPVALTKVDLSHNPLGPSKALLRNLSGLKRLKELRLEKAEIGDDSFPPDTFSSNPFPTLALLDASETQASRPVVEAALHGVKQDLDFEFSTADPPVGVLRVLVGKQLRKEPWELELERRARERVLATTSFTDDWTENLPPPRSTSRASQVTTPPLNATPSTPKKPVPREVIKEAWEIEVEQGLTTEAGRRRAKTAAASIDASSPPALNEKQLSSQAVPPLENPKYFNSQTMTLTLPPSAAVKAGHSRAFSVASTPFGTSVSEMGELSLPTPTLPLATIVTQTFANSLKVLVLTNRRMDRSFSVPGSLSSIGISVFLPVLEELNLEGCNLADAVPIHWSEEDGSAPQRTSEPILPTLAKLFPSLKRLNLSYNALTDAALKTDALSELTLSTPQRGGLRSLSLRGNRLSDLEGFKGVAEMFRGNRDVPEWKLDELDVRDNDIGKLAPELGLLPLEVFLVEGNTSVGLCCSFRYLLISGFLGSVFHSVASGREKAPKVFSAGFAGGLSSCSGATQTFLSFPLASFRDIHPSFLSITLSQDSERIMLPISSCKHATSRHPKVIICPTA